jgi:hypothetical protein
MNPNELNRLLHQVVVTYHNKIVNDVASPIAQDTGLPPPKEVQRLLDSTNALLNETGGTPRAPEFFPSELLPWLKRAVLDARLDLANWLDDSKALISDGELVEKLDEQLEPYEEMIRADWFTKTTAARTPHGRLPNG